MEGGFDGGMEKVEYEEQSSLVVLPEFASITLPNPQLPQKVPSSQPPFSPPPSTLHYINAQMHSSGMLSQEIGISLFSELVNIV